MITTWFCYPHLFAISYRGCWKTFCCLFTPYPTGIIRECLFKVYVSPFNMTLIFAFSRFPINHIPLNCWFFVNQVIHHIHDGSSCKDWFYHQRNIIQSNMTSEAVTVLHVPRNDSKTQTWRNWVELSWQAPSSHNVVFIGEQPVMHRNVIQSMMAQVLLFLCILPRILVIQPISVSGLSDSLQWYFCWIFLVISCFLLPGFIYEENIVKYISVFIVLSST